MTGATTESAPTPTGRRRVRALLLSDRGRQTLRWVAENFERHQDKLFEWNEAAEREIARLEEALERVADSIEGMEEAR